MNLDDARRFLTDDRPGWAADHANGIVTLHAGLGELQPIMNESLSDEPGVAIVSCRTCFDAIVAPSAAMKVNDHRLSAIVQTVLHDELKQLARLKLLSGQSFLIGNLIASRSIFPFRLTAFLFLTVPSLD